MSVAGLESTYLADFAAFLLGASKADDWYSVNCLSEGIPNLPGLFGISEKKLNEFLVLSGFGKLVRGDCFRFWPDKFNNFLVMSEIGDYCKHTLSRVKGFSKRSQHFIRVGCENSSSMSKPGAIGHGPRIRILRNLQTT
jgi:hypothetical protein